MSEAIYTIDEARKYFANNPVAYAVGFAMLTETQLEQADKGEAIEGDLNLIQVEVNPNIEQVIKNHYNFTINDSVLIQ